LTPRPLALAAPRAKLRIYLDAGHGAPGNPGNHSATCVDEQDFTLALSGDLGEALERTGRFEVRISRARGVLVPYAERVRDAEAWGAAALVSLHSDVRGRAESWEPRPGVVCSRSRAAPGFSVLWSDYAEGALVERRVRLARSLARELAATGLLPYSGEEYLPQYLPDAQPGVFVDRHRDSERIFVLWRPSMPSVIIETHNALDDREERRWSEPATRAVFASAVAAALATSLDHESR
jgi:N-acetylmuramoyl-L-alanine amidase